MNIAELEKFVLLLREGLNENIKVFSSDLDYLTKNYSVIVNDLTKIMQKLEDFIVSQKKINENLKLQLLQLKKEPKNSNSNNKQTKKSMFKESMFKDLKNIKNTPKSKNIKIIKKEPVKLTKKKGKKE